LLMVEFHIKESYCVKVPFNNVTINL